MNQKKVTMNYKSYTVVSFIPKTDSEATEWIQWHKQLKKRFGKKKANLIFMKEEIATFFMKIQTFKLK